MHPMTAWVPLAPFLVSSPTMSTNTLSNTAQIKPTSYIEKILPASAPYPLVHKPSPMEQGLLSYQTKLEHQGTYSDQSLYEYHFSTLQPKASGQFFRSHTIESWLQNKLKEIAQANPGFFENLVLSDVSVTFKAHNSGIASVHTKSLTVTLGPKAFELTDSSNEVVAIFCHELAHIILGHESFSTTPPSWVENNCLYQAQKARADHLHQSIPITNLAKRFRALDALEKKVIKAYNRHCSKIDGESKTISIRQSTSAPLTKQEKTLLKNFAQTQTSKTCRDYLQLLDIEQEYQSRLNQWQQSEVQLHNIIDTILGETGAWRNWREEQADKLGYILFKNWAQRNKQAQPEDYLMALVNTLSPKEPDLAQYHDMLKQHKNLELIPAPARSSNSHPSPKWRVYRLMKHQLNEA